MRSGDGGKIFLCLCPVFENCHDGRSGVDFDPVNCLENDSRIAIRTFHPACNDQPSSSPGGDVEQGLQFLDELRFEQQRPEFACCFPRFDPSNAPHQPGFFPRRKMRSNPRPNSFTLANVEQLVRRAVEEIHSRSLRKRLKGRPIEGGF